MLSLVGVHIPLSVSWIFEWVLEERGLLLQLLHQTLWNLHAASVTSRLCFKPRFTVQLYELCLSDWSWDFRQQFRSCSTVSVLISLRLKVFTYFFVLLSGDCCVSGLKNGHWPSWINSSSYSFQRDLNCPLVPLCKMLIAAISWKNSMNILDFWPGRDWRRTNWLWAGFGFPWPSQCCCVELRPALWEPCQN